MTTEQLTGANTSSRLQQWLLQNPDPQLIPLLADRVPLDSIYCVAMMAHISADGGGAHPPFFSIRDLTCQALARRWQEFDPALMLDVLQYLPRCLLYLDPPSRAVLDLGDVDGIGGNVEVYLAVSSRDAERARQIATQLVNKTYAFERQGLGLLVPLLEGELHQQAVELLLQDDSQFALEGWMDLAQVGLLKDAAFDAMYDAQQQGSMWPRIVVAATLAPLVDDHQRSSLLQFVGDESPYDFYFADWYQAILLARLAPWLDPALLVPWIEAMNEPYHGYFMSFIERLQNGALKLAPPGSLRELLQAHPSGLDIQQALVSLPVSETSDLCRQAMDEIADHNAGAARMAVAAPPEIEFEPEPVAEPEPQKTEATPRQKRTLRGMFDGLDGDEETFADADMGDFDEVPMLDDPDLDPADDQEASDTVSEDASKQEADGAGAGGHPELPERFVQAAVLEGSRRRMTFLAGQRNDLCCWIGPDDPQDPLPRAVATERIREQAVPTDGLLLDVLLKYNGQEKRGKLFLPKDPRSRTADCILSIDIPGDETLVSAEIAFLHQGRAFEIITLTAPVLEPGEAEIEGKKYLRVKTEVSRREVIDLSDREPVDALAVVKDGKLSIFGTRGSGNFTLQHTAPAIEWLNKEIFATDKSLVRRQQPDNKASGLNADDQETLDFLRNLAVHGNLLYKELISQGFEDPGESIQLMNLDPTAYVPLEFVYDRGYPIENAPLCERWQEALEGDATYCPGCKAASELSLHERDAMTSICPLGFWSLQKIIERHDSQPGQKPENRSAPVDGANDLAPISSVLFASSNRVEADDRDATFAALSQCFSRVEKVKEWEAWKQFVSVQGPQLLVAMPHHGMSSAMSDTLEIGENDVLEQGRLSELYVTRTTQGPGPLIVLFGCETQIQSEMGYVSFARDFTRHRAAIVVGTLAKVLGRHAAPVAQSLARELAQVQQRERASKLLRRIRRRMLGKGYLMALCLVALGDGDWWLTPVTGDSEPT